MMTRQIDEQLLGIIRSRPVWVDEMVTDAVKNGADVNCHGDDGATPLMLASGIPQKSLVEMFLRLGARVDAVDGRGRTALFYACAMGRGWAVAETLLDNGADVNASDDEGSTPLFVACQNRNLSIVQRLVARGADVNVRNVHGETPLACARKVPRNGKVIQLLVNISSGSGADE